MRTQVLLSVETEETQLGSLGDQVLSYLYYSGYMEPSTTKATQNTPIVLIRVPTSQYESYRVTSIRVIPSHEYTSHIESVSKRVTTSHTKRRDVHPHIPKPSIGPCLRLGSTYTRDPSQAGTMWGQSFYYFLTWPLERSPECASW